MSAPRGDVVERLVEEMLAGLDRGPDQEVTMDEMFSAVITMTLRTIKVALQLDPTCGPRIESEGLYPLIAACNPAPSSNPSK